MTLQQSTQSPAPTDQPVVFYHGTNIYFRPVEPADEPLIHRWDNDPRIWATLNHRKPAPSLVFQKKIEQRAHDPNTYWFGITRASDHQLVGTCALKLDKDPAHQAEFGLIIGDTNAHNKGIGYEATTLSLRFAFQELNLHRVELATFPFNPRAIHIYEKAGYRLEARRKQAFYRNDTYHDTLDYAILRQEWDAIQQRQTTNPSEHAA